MYDNDGITGAFGLCTCIRSNLGRKAAFKRFKEGTDDYLDRNDSRFS